MSFSNPTDSAPGFQARVETEHVQVWAPGRNNSHQLMDAHLRIASGNTDAGNTPTTTLRGGNLLSRDEASGLEYIYDPDSVVKGVNEVYGVLEEYLSMLNYQGVAETKYSVGLKSAELKAAKLPNLDQQAAAQLWRLGCTFSYGDLPTYRGAAFGPHPAGVRYVTGDTNVEVTDNGRLFAGATADCDFTLPAIEPGLYFEFVMTTNHELKISSAEGDNIIAFNDASADAITWSTTGEQIGVYLGIMSIYVNGALKWLPRYFMTNGTVGVHTQESVTT